MKVLQLWRSHSHRRGGGGAVSMSRIHRSLQRHGIDSRLLCETGDGSGGLPPVSFAERRLRALTARLGLNDVHRLSSFRLPATAAFREADVVHFHGLHSGFVNYLALPLLTRDKPVVFTLRDMWGFTGHCAYTGGCERWRTGCGCCPHPEAPPAVQRDATRLEWRLKNWAYRHSSLTVVAISKWMRELARQSMLSRFPIRYIPNGVELENFYPRDRQAARAALGIPAKKHVILFASVDVEDRRKGGDLLLAALRKLPPGLRSDAFLLVLGKRGERLAAEVGGVSHRCLGNVDDPDRLAEIYSAADVFAFPSRQDAFGNVALESLACGTPVVAFASGGVAEVVRTGDTGYLARAQDAADFARGLEELLSDATERERQGAAGRALIVREYSSELEARRYIQLYRELCEEGSAGYEPFAPPGQPRPGH